MCFHVEKSKTQICKQKYCLSLENGIATVKSFSNTVQNNMIPYMVQHKKNTDHGSFSIFDTVHGSFSIYDLTRFQPMSKYITYVSWDETLLSHR